ncbi:hypothetical protein AS890_17940 [Rhizobium anhuiense bv. trifolii]|jgi:hypothetical protein|nr:hypothetical protein AS890_17940 [Rhizobium anhuiense bv. trifolii]
MPIGASLGVSDIQGIVRNHGEDSRNLLPFTVGLTAKRQTATRVYTCFCHRHQAKKSGFIQFFKALAGILIEAMFRRAERMGTSWNPARCQPIETKETLT